MPSTRRLKRKAGFVSEVNGNSDHPPSWSDLQNAPRVRQAALDSLRIDRLPPHSIEAEQGVIGCILLDPPSSLALCVKREVRHELFYDLRHQELYSQITRLYDSGSPVDLITLAQALKDANILNQVGGLAYLASLADCVPSAANLDAYLTLVESKYFFRKAVHSCSDITSHAYEHEGDAEALAALFSYYAKQLRERFGSVESITVRSPNDIMTMPQDENDCILADRMLAKGQSMTILGAGGIGKSRLALQLAVATITGRQFVGLQTRCPELRWFFIQAENSNRRLRFDLDALRKWVGDEDWEMVNSQMAIHTLETDIDSFLALQDPSAQLRLSKAIDAQQPDIIVWDSLYNFSNGDLNADVDMRDTLAIMSRLSRSGNPNRCIVPLHHSLTGKSGIAKSTGFDRSSFGRNSKVLHSWTRGQMNFAPGSPDSNDLLVVTCGKCSNGKEFAPFAIRLNADMIYQVDDTFDISEWKEAVTSDKVKQTPISLIQVAACCSGEMPCPDLVKIISETFFIGKTAAYKKIGQCIQSKLLIQSRITKNIMPKLGTK